MTEPHHTAESLLAAHGKRLSSLVGQRVNATWTAWDLNDNEWLCGEPVILKIGTTNLEIRNTELSTMWIGYDSIDLQSPPSFTDWASEDILTEWRQKAEPNIDGAVGKTVASIEIIELQASFEPASVDEKQTSWRMAPGIEFKISSPPKDGKEQLTAWTLAGIGLTFTDNTYLEITNGIDYNEVATKRTEGEALRYTSVKFS